MRGTTTCPSRTRVFGNLDDPASAVARLVASGRAGVRLPEAGTKPKVYYLQGDAR